MVSPARALIHAGTSEHTWQDTVIRLAHFNGWLVHAMHDSRDIWWACDAGFPDLFMVRGDRAIAAELKTMKGRLSDGQKEWQARFVCTPVEYHCWKPCDEDEVQRVLA